LLFALIAAFVAVNAFIRLRAEYKKVEISELNGKPALPERTYVELTSRFNTENVYLIYKAVVSQYSVYFTTFPDYNDVLVYCDCDYKSSLPNPYNDSFPDVHQLKARILDGNPLVGSEGWGYHTDDVI